MNNLFNNSRVERGELVEGMGVSVSAEKSPHLTSWGEI